MITTAIVFEDGNPVRAFKDDKCIYSAYRWAHHHYCLADEGYAIHQLPTWLEVKFYCLTQEQFDNIVK